MKRTIFIALLLSSTLVMADDSAPGCTQRPVDTRSTTVKVFNGITTVLHAIDPTVWIARGILAVIPGPHNAPAPTYCDDVEPQAKPEDQPATTDALASQGTEP